MLPFITEDIYSHCSHIENKRKYAGFENFPTLEEIFLKFSFTFNKDLNFNVENLIHIKKSIDKEIMAILMSKKELKRSEIEILFLGETQEYGTLLLETLNENLSNFIGVANVYLNENEYSDKDPEVLKKRQVHFIRDVRDLEIKNFEIKLNYAIIKTKHQQCPRCLFNKSKEQNKICEDCQKTFTSKR